MHFMGELKVAPLRFCGSKFGVGWGGVSVLGFAGVSLKDSRTAVVFVRDVCLLQGSGVRLLFLCSSADM